MSAGKETLCGDAYAVRRAVARWLRIRAEHVEDSWGVSEYLVPRDKQKDLLIQLSADRKRGRSRRRRADHSDLLIRLLEGHEPLPFDEWEASNGR